MNNTSPHFVPSLLRPLSRLPPCTRSAGEATARRVVERPAGECAALGVRGAMLGKRHAQRCPQPPNARVAPSPQNNWEKSAPPRKTHSMSSFPSSTSLPIRQRTLTVAAAPTPPQLSTDKHPPSAGLSLLACRSRGCSLGAPAVPAPPVHRILRDGTPCAEGSLEDVQPAEAGEPGRKPRTDGRGH